MLGSGQLDVEHLAALLVDTVLEGPYDYRRLTAHKKHTCPVISHVDEGLSSGEIHTLAKNRPLFRVEGT